MKSRTVLGAILIFIGLAAFVYQGISYTTRDKVVDLGAVQVTAERHHTFPLPPIVGAVALIAGLALLLLGRD